MSTLSLRNPNLIFPPLIGSNPPFTKGSLLFDIIVRVSVSVLVPRFLVDAVPFLLVAVPVVPINAGTCVVVAVSVVTVPLFVGSTVSTVSTTVVV
jgi:hypothetical protein